MALPAKQLEQRVISAEHGARGAIAAHDASSASSAIKGAQESAVVKTLEGFSFTTNLLWIGDLVLGALAFPIGYAAKVAAGDKGKAWVQGVFKTPIRALQETRLGNVGALGANAVGTFAQVANENNAPELARKAGAKAENLAASGKRFTDSVNKAFAPLGAPFKGIFARAEARAASGIATGGVVTKIAGWRAARVDKGQHKIIEKIMVANNNELLSPIASMKRAVGMNVALTPAPALSHVAPILHAVKAPNAHSDAIRHAIAAVNDNVPSDLSDAVKKRIGKVVELAEKAAQRLDKKTALEKVSKGGFSAIIAGIPRALSRVSLFHAIMATGIVAGGVALAMRAKQENFTADTALKDMAADLYGVSVDKLTPQMISGKDAPLILQKAAQNMQSQTHGNWAAAGLRTAGEAVFLVPGAAAMIANMALSTGSDMLKSDNPFVKAYGVLKEAEKAPDTVSEQQKISLVSMLVAASPAFEKHGGVRNKLVQPIAQQLIKEGLSARQIALEVSNAHAIEKRAADVTLSAQTAQKSPAVPAAEATPSLPVTPERPDMKPSNITSHGRVVNAQHALHT